MAATGPLIQQMPQGIEIRGRRRMNTEQEFEVLLDDLQKRILQLQQVDENASLTIMDCDLSQNKLAPEHFESLFAVLGGGNVRVQRYRLFGCPTINDEVVKSLGEYFKLLTGDTAPSELHLSDCSITSDGFDALMSAIEESEAFPLVHPVSKKKTPLYLRLENNYIEEAHIQERVDAGLIRPFKKTTGSWNSRSETTAKVDLVVRTDRQYQQKQGPPPSPEEAGPFKEVFDKRQQEQQQQQWQKGQNGKGQWQQGKGQWQQWPAMMQQPVRPQFGQWQAPGKGGAPRPLVMPLRPGMQQQQPQLITPRTGFAQQQPILANAKGAGKGVPAAMWPRAAGTAGAAMDRSRTPLRNAFSAMPQARQFQPQVRQAMPPSKPPPGKEKPLPHPWEEHWSDEYNIPYFWNSETGDSLWERPT